MKKVKTYFSNVNALNDKDIFEFFYNKVSRARRGKIDCLKFQKDKNLSLAVGILLQVALKEEGIENCQIEIGQFGKPSLINNKNLFFNLSHSEEMAMCVIATSPVGCDIERIKKCTPDISRIVLSEGEKMDNFYQIWTAKESYLKMTGEGLNKDLKSINIEIPLKKQYIFGREVTFIDVSCKKDYAATICVEGDVCSLQISIENIDLLNSNLLGDSCCLID